ncbi:hypothetical protein TNCV_4489411 [Trichonephila clavipes]|nr:hypothetical protein TNCV_4489411 [Trichonephila clavipes]
MPKYKVGDVAALFPKPLEPKTDSGKKIQSLFDEFYKKLSKKTEKPKQTPYEFKKKISGKNSRNEKSQVKNQSQPQFLFTDVNPLGGSPSLGEYGFHAPEVP